MEKTPDYIGLARETEDTIINCLRPFGGCDINNEIVREMVNDLYTAVDSITPSEINTTVSHFGDHVCVHLEHERGPDVYFLTLEAKLR